MHKRLAALAATTFAAAAIAAIVAPLSAQPPRPANPTDIAGEWTLTNNEEDTTAQPPLGDYLGIPFNAAGRQRADTTAESIWGTPEYQCRPHSAPHQWRGLGGARILKEQDPLTRDVRAYHVQFMRSLDWPIFMDGRPHPPAWAPHSWTGFSTGQWIGNTLKVTTTHLKDGYLKRGGPQTSDMYWMTDYITRHDEILTIVTVVDDPVYQDEPYVESTTYTIDLTSNVAMETCNGSSFAENGGTDRHHVPHFLPGQNTALTEWLKKDHWIPVEPTRGSAWGWASPYMNAVISSPAPPNPIRYIINTSAASEHVGGNEKLATAGFFPRGGGFGSAVSSVGREASIVAHENVLNRLSTPAGPGAKPAPAAAQPTDTYFDEFHKLPEYFNGEAVILYGAPRANTDGASLAFFRHSEVISAGNIFSTISYPAIDLEKGGGIQGVIDGL